MKRIKWSVSLKLLIALIFTSSVCILGVGVYSYFNLSETIESLLGARLQNMALTATVGFSQEDHNLILKDYLEQIPAEEMIKKPHYQRVSAYLANIQKINGLSSEIYTLLKPDWVEKTMIFVAGSGAKIVPGNGLPLAPENLEGFEKGRHGHTKLYKDSEGIWISGFAPIKTDSTYPVLLQIDYKADTEVAAAKFQLLMSLFVPGLAGLLISIFLGLLIGRRMAAPISVLAETAKKVGAGDLNSKSKVRTNDEIGILGESFDQMIDEIRESRQKIEEYNRTLEKKVEERTLQLKEAGERMKLILDSLKLSVFMTNREGIIEAPVSMFSENIFGQSIEGKNVIETVFNGIPRNTEIFSNLNTAMSCIFDSDQIQYLLMEEHLPGRFIAPGNKKLDQDKTLRCVYSPLWDVEGNLAKLLFTVEDITELERLAKEVEATKAENALFMNTLMEVVTVGKTKVEDFLSQVESRLISLLGAEKFNQNSFVLDVKVPIHTFKGTARILGLQRFATEMHKLEAEIEIYQKRNEPTSSYIMLVKETIHRSLADYRKIIAIIYGTGGVLANPALAPLQPPLKDLTNDLEKSVKRVADQAKVPIEFKINGIIPQWESKIVSGLKEALVHLVNNSLDHGFQVFAQTEKTNQGPPPMIEISFSEENGTGIVHFADNGVGVDFGNVTKVAQQKGIKTSEFGSPEVTADFSQLLCTPGFTSKDTATEISGRGIGLTSVKEVVKGLGGTIFCGNRKNKSGFEVIMKFPLIESAKTNSVA